MALYNITTQKEFEEKVTNSSKIVLVDFWAQWCPPCRAMAPILEKIASTMDKTVDIVKIDVEASQDNATLAGRYGVQGIPNMNIFKKGAVVDTIVGMVPEMHLKDVLSSHAK